MSKSSIKEEFIENEKFLNYFAETLNDLNKKAIIYSQTMDSLIKGSLEREVIIKNANRMTQAEVKKSISKILSTYSDLGIEFGKKGEKMIKHLQDITLKQVTSKQGLSAEKFRQDFIHTGLTEIIKNAQSALKKGDTDSFIKNFSNNDLAKSFAEEIDKKLGIQVDTLNYKLQSLFGNFKKEFKKDMSKLGKDLVEGLEKSKFIGGALTDTFKLLGLMGASWLSHFGQLGRTLGGAFYIAMSTLGPSLVQLLIKHVSSLLWNVTKFLATKLLDLGKFLAPKLFNIVRHPVGSAKAVGGALANLAVKGGGSLGELITAGTTAQKAVALGKVAGGLGVAAAGATGAVLAGREAGKDWKSGHKGRAVGFGIGAGLMGAGGIAAIVGLFSAAVAPFALPLVAIGAGIAGLVALWKKFGDNISDWFKKLFKIKDAEAEKDNEKTGFWTNFINWLKGAWEHRPKWLGGDGGESEPSVNPVDGLKNNFSDTKVGRYAGAQDLTAVKKIGSLGINKYGQMTNIGSMTQDQASSAIQEYMRQDRQSFDKNYEILDSKYASFGAYRNDAVVKDSKGNITGVLAAKGTKARIDEYRENMRKAGVPESVANQFLLTGGMSTKDSPHKKGGAYSHSNIAGEAYDFYIPQGAYSKTMFDVVRKTSYEQGYDARWEGFDKGGKFRFLKDYQSGFSNAHIDMKKRRGYNRPSEGALQNLEENKEKQKVQAEQHQLQAMKLVKDLEGEKRFQEIAKQNITKSPEELEQEYKKELLNKYGVFTKKDKEGRDQWLYTDENMKVREFDPSGNLEMLKRTMTHMTNHEQ